MMHPSIQEMDLRDRHPSWFQKSSITKIPDSTKDGEYIPVDEFETTIFSSDTWLDWNSHDEERHSKKNCLASEADGGAFDALHEDLFRIHNFASDSGPTSGGTKVCGNSSFAHSVVTGNIPNIHFWNSGPHCWRIIWCATSAVGMPLWGD